MKVDSHSKVNVQSELFGGRHSANKHSRVHRKNKKHREHIHKE